MFPSVLWEESALANEDTCVVLVESWGYLFLVTQQVLFPCFLYTNWRGSGVYFTVSLPGGMRVSSGVCVFHLYKCSSENHSRLESDLDCSSHIICVSGKHLALDTYASWYAPMCAIFYLCIPNVSTKQTNYMFSWIFSFIKMWRYSDVSLTYPIRTS